MASCRGCGAPLHREDALCDLGALPLANALLSEDQLDEPEVHYPLRPLICRECLLVQLPALDRDSIFGAGYPFFAGASASWGAHCRRLADKLAEELSLGPTSRVLDVGSNDGTMLRRFRGLKVPALGVEPCSSVAQHAQMEGLSTIVDFWGVDCAERLLRTQGVTMGRSWRADLVVATNVLAHVPDLQDFLCGVRAVLAPGGVAVFEVSYLGDLVARGAFDQVYAEHYSYFSANSLCAALEIAGLRPCKVEFLPIHGGSIRVYADGGRDDAMAESLYGILEAERKAPWHSVEGLRAFAEVPPAFRRRSLAALSRYADAPVVGYGASAKAATMLSYLGLGPETFEFVADVTPAKWGRYLPGSRIPIRAPKQLADRTPEVVVNFLWNWQEESARNIRAAAPGARIVGLAPDPEPLAAAA